MTMGQQFDSPWTILEVQCETQSAQFIVVLFPLVISIASHPGRMGGDSFLPRGLASYPGRVGGGRLCFTLYDAIMKGIHTAFFIPARYIYKKNIDRNHG